MSWWRNRGFPQSSRTQWPLELKLLVKPPLGAAKRAIQVQVNEAGTRSIRAEGGDGRGEGPEFTAIALSEVESPPM